MGLFNEAWQDAVKVTRKNLKKKRGQWEHELDITAQDPEDAYDLAEKLLERISYEMAEEMDKFDNLHGLTVGAHKRGDTYQMKLYYKKKRSN